MEEVPDTRTIRVKKRVGISLMIGGLGLGMVVAAVWATRWAFIGTALSLAGYVVFSLADPADRPPRRRPR